MTRRRWIVLAAASALALVLAWRAWPQDRAVHDGAVHDGPISSRQARTGPRPASARRAPPPGATNTSPATPDFGAVKTRIAACDDFVERAMTCAQLPDDAKIAIAEASKAWAELTGAGPQPDLEASCRATASVQGESLAAMGC